MTPHAYAPSETERDVAFVLGIRGRRPELARCGVKMPCGVEQMRVGAERAGVPVDCPDVGDEKRALGNEVALVPKVLERTRQPPRLNQPPQLSWVDLP